MRAQTMNAHAIFLFFLPEKPVTVAALRLSLTTPSEQKNKTFGHAKQTRPFAHAQTINQDKRFK